MRDFLLNKVAPFIRTNGVAIFLVFFTIAIAALMFSLRNPPTPAVPSSPTPVIGGPEAPLTSDPPPAPTWSPPNTGTLPPPPAARRAHDGGR